MRTTIKAISRFTILLALVCIILVITVLAEIMIDQLTTRSGDMRHLLKHSLGNIGTLMIGLSLLGYTLKKKFKKFPGKMKDWLEIHESFAVVGVVLIGIHTGAHFNAVAPVVTFILMIACIISGFVGRNIYVKAKSETRERRKEFLKNGFTVDEIEEKLALDITATEAMSKWREFHRPLSSLLALFLSWHIVSALFFGG